MQPSAEQIESEAKRLAESGLYPLVTSFEAMTETGKHLMRRRAEYELRKISLLKGAYRDPGRRSPH